MSRRRIANQELGFKTSHYMTFALIPNSLTIFLSLVEFICNRRVHLLKKRISFSLQSLSLDLVLDFSF